MVFLKVRCDCSKDDLGIKQGNYTLTKNLESGSLLVYQFAEAFYPHPTTRRCQSNGHWTPSSKRFPQTCKPVKCPDPNVLENGNVSPFQERYSVGHTTRSECYPGYTLQGSSSRTCLSNGKWSGSTPICSHDSGDTCSDPGVPAGASRRGNLFATGAIVMYTCKDNTFLVGSQERTCQENGRWTGREPACYCTFPRCLTNVSFLSLTFLGRMSLLKRKPGKLNIYIALDISDNIEEIIIERTKLAIITLLKKIAAFTVSPNYEILFFSADVYEVVSIVEFYEGNVTLDSAIKNLEDFQIGDKSTGTDVNAALKKFEEGMAWIEQKTGDKFSEHRHVFLLFTDGAYNMGGSPLPTLARIKNRVYMSPTGDPGSRLDYLGDYVFGIGAEIFDEALLPLTAGTEGEAHYFRLKRDTNLAAIFDEVIDDGASQNRCGLHKDYELEEDSDSKRKRYPWFALIRIQMQGRMMFCSGSLVSPHFVLTAAHCFPSGYKPENIKFLFFLTDKNVKKIFVHPNFNIKARKEQGVTEFYDYDIALIQLEDPKIMVYILTFVSRPICIPCTQQTSKALKLPGRSTCIQQEELLLKNQKEKLNFLSENGDSASVKEKVVHAKFGKSRDLCIQEVLNVRGMRISDPTVAVTENFLCTGGDGDHIACAGDGGQAVFKIHQNRAIGVVSWGTELLCHHGKMQKSTTGSRDFHINLFRVVPFLKSILGNETQDEYPHLTFLSD
uniref:C3/C5 convertase n=1 Tax=Oryzias latipes TaxID=8090 RepID=A0A3B3HMA3_ORYLA